MAVADSHSCRKLSVDGACPSLVTSVVQMPTKTIPELSKPAFGVLPKTGDAEPEDPGKPGWERSRMICARSILAWRRQGDALGIDRHGVHSWRRLRLLDTLRREREWPSEIVIYEKDPAQLYQIAQRLFEHLQQTNNGVLCPQECIRQFSSQIAWRNSIK